MPSRFVSGIAALGNSLHGWEADLLCEAAVAMPAINRPMTSKMSF